MKNTTTRVIISCLLVWTSSAYSQKLLTVEDLFGSTKFDSKTLNSVQWTPDGKGFTCLGHDEETGALQVILYTIKNGERTVFIDSREIPYLEERKRAKRFMLDNYIWSPDSKRILLPSKNDLYLYDLKTKKAIPLTNDDMEERDPTFSPDGLNIAYLKNNNLYVLNILKRKETQLTFQGTNDLLVGRFDWVYEEEFGIRTGFFWSPDSRQIAYYEVNTVNIPFFPIVDFIPIHNETQELRYAKAGDPNSIIRIGVVPAEGGKTTWMNTGSDGDIYIARIHWLKDSKQLGIQKLNRLQNKLSFLIANTANGTTHEILTEEDPGGWVDVWRDLTFIDTNRLIWASERNDWRHLYLYDTKGNLIRQLTNGNWTVDRFLGIDKTKEWIYFIGTEKSILERHLYRIKLDGTEFQRLTKEEGTHTITMSPDCAYYLDEFSNVTTPPRTTLFNGNGNTVRMVESGEIPALKDYKIAEPEFITITTDDSFKLGAYLIKPVDFDSRKKYPVIMYNYPGPGSQQVRNSWQISLGRNGWHQLMAQKGYLIFCVDVRGSGYKGNDDKNILYKNIGLGILDLINGAKYLKTLSYVDGNRIGIWGWSGGGWGTCMALTLGADYFKAGCAVASVTDFRNYNTIWTERYMGLPSDNPEGYAKSSPLTYVNKYKGGLFLLHGSSDDNVHLSNIMQLIYVLQNEGKPFELMIYPRKLHSIRGSNTRVHLYNAMTKFFLREL